MARTSRKQVEGVFNLTKDQAVRCHVEDAETWELDFNGVYGGYRITSRNGSHDVTQQRVPAGEMYRTLHAIWYVLTDIGRL